MKPALTVLEHETVPVAATAGPGRLSEQEAEEAARIALRRPGFCQRGYRSLRFSQYGGVVNLAGRALEILPKVEKQTQPAAHCRGAFLRLLALAGDLPLSALQALGQATREASLLEVFIAAFFDELGLLLRGGLLRRYREESDELPLLRGRLLIADQLRCHALRHDRLACRYDELSADNDWNRVLKTGLGAVRPWLNSPRLRRRWSELWPAFDDVREPAAADVFARLSPDRQVVRYAAAVRWARWIVASCSPALRAGTAMAPGLLFDANQLFERAVAGHLRTRCARHPARLELLCQDSGTFLARIAAASRAHPAVPVRPDLLLRENGMLRLIADTKWKCIEPGRNGHVEPSVQDVHQLLAYAAAYRCGDVALIYPWHAGLRVARETVLELPSTRGAAVRLHVVVVDVGAAELPLRLGSATPWLGQLFGAAVV